MFEIGKTYDLVPLKPQCILKRNYVIKNAKYIGFYDDYGKVSYKFVHQVQSEDYMKFTRVWGYLTTNLNSNSEIMETHVYQDKFIKGWILSIEKNN